MEQIPKPELNFQLRTQILVSHKSFCLISWVYRITANAFASALWYYQQLLWITWLIMQLSSLPCGQILSHPVVLWVVLYKSLGFWHFMMLGGQGNFQENVCSQRMCRLTMYFSLLFQLPLTFCHCSVSSVTQLMTLLESWNAPQLCTEWLMDFVSQTPEMPWDSCVDPWGMGHYLRTHPYWEISPYIRMCS